MITLKEFLLICEKQKELPVKKMDIKVKKLSAEFKKELPRDFIRASRIVGRMGKIHSAVRGKKIEEKKSIPPNAVAGTYKEVDGVKSYTLSDAPIKSHRTAEKVTKELEKQGGTGGSAIKKYLKKRAKKLKKIEEQTPTMEPNLYSQQVAKRQASQKTAHVKHVHQELGAEARAQQAAKTARMKAIMSR